jgi:hypothetical protein
MNGRIEAMAASIKIVKKAVSNPQSNTQPSLPGCQSGTGKAEEDSCDRDPAQTPTTSHARTENPPRYQQPVDGDTFGDALVY